jgi:hypothetical protein
VTPFLMILLFIAFAAIAILAAVAAHKAAQKRREELRALAAELGFTFDPGNDTGHDERYSQFEVFRRGHSRAAYNTFRGSVEIDGRQFPTQMGDFTYKITTSNGKSTSTTTYNLSYLIVHLPFQNVPGLAIRREGLFDKLAGVLGFDDIDFESIEFSRRFHVSSRDKRFAYDVIDPRMMEFLMQGDPPVIAIEQGQCCFHAGNRRWTPLEFKAMLGWTRDFFDRWPDHVTASLEKC